jgi:flagellar hook assembly protein FlgD
MQFAALQFRRWKLNEQVMKVCTHTYEQNNEFASHRLESVKEEGKIHEELEGQNTQDVDWNEGNKKTKWERDDEY